MPFFWQSDTYQNWDKSILWRCIHGTGTCWKSHSSHLTKHNCAFIIQYRLNVTFPQEPMTAENTFSDVLQLKRLATDVQIQAILNLSCQVFGTTIKDSAESRFASLSEWRGRLTDPKSRIFYICDTESRPVAFLFLHPKSLMNKDHLHIWLAGVSEQYRQLGLWKNLLDAAHIHAQNLDMPLSIRTNQYKFPAMYAFLSGSFNWQEYERDDSGSITYVLAK